MPLTYLLNQSQIATYLIALQLLFPHSAEAFNISQIHTTPSHSMRGAILSRAACSASSKNGQRSCVPVAPKKAAQGCAAC